MIMMCRKQKKTINQIVHRSLLVLFILFLSSYALFIKAQTGKELRKHVIIALDRHPGNYPLMDASIMVPRMNEILEDILSSEEDYVSVVNYSLGINDSTFNKYTTCTVNWSSSKVFFVTMANYWPEVAYLLHSNEGAPCSMITGSKYYSFHALYKKNEGKGANRTYLLQVTDGVFNGDNDYKTEFQRGYKGIKGILDYAEFRETITSITENYHFKLLKEYPIKGEYKAILFEVTPNQTTLNSVLNYPAYLGIHRVRGGYRIEFDYNNVTVDSLKSHSSYKLHRLEISPMKNGEPIKTAAFTEDAGHVTMDIDGSDVSGDLLKVEMRGWLEPKDEIYSGLIMNPYDEDFKNLNVNLSLPLNNDPKIFGVIPLYDFMWWWYPNDILRAVYIWDIVLVLILILVMIYIQRTLSKKMGLYIPTNNVISMNVKSARNESSVPVSESGINNRPKRLKNHEK